MPDLSLGSAVPVPESASGHMVAYEGPIIVGTFTGDAADLGVIRWMARADRPVEVRGHRAWIGADSPRATPAAVGVVSTTRTVVWQESPGVLAVVRASDIGEAKLLGIAENLRPASDLEWDALLARIAPDDGTDDAPATTARARPGSGTPAVPDQAVVYLRGRSPVTVLVDR